VVVNSGHTRTAHHPSNRNVRMVSFVNITTKNKERPHDLDGHDRRRLEQTWHLVIEEEDRHLFILYKTILFALGLDVTINPQRDEINV